HAVVARLVASGQPEAVVREAVLPEELLHNVRYRLLLEDATVRGAGKEPQPWDDLGAIRGVPPHRTRLREPADDPVQVAIAAAGRDRDGDVFPDDRVEVRLLVAADHLRLEVKEGRYPLGPAERRDEQRVGPEGSFDPEAAIFLGEGVCHPSLVL